MYILSMTYYLINLIFQKIEWWNKREKKGLNRNSLLSLFKKRFSALFHVILKYSMLKGILGYKKKEIFSLTSNFSIVSTDNNLLPVFCWVSREYKLKNKKYTYGECEAKTQEEEAWILVPSLLISEHSFLICKMWGLNWVTSNCSESFRNLWA